MVKQDAWAVVAEADIACSVCDQRIPVPVLGRVEREDGQFEIKMEPDMTDVWAHVWSHDDA